MENLRSVNISFPLAPRGRAGSRLVEHGAAGGRDAYNEYAMAGSCRTFSHTADIGLEAQADSLSELFAVLAEGLSDLIVRRSMVSASQTRRLSVEAENLEDLLVDFLNGVLEVIETQRMAVAGVKVLQAGRKSVDVELSGEPLDPARHEIGAEVKAATYHQLKIAREGERWQARVILDV